MKNMKKWYKTTERELSAQNEKYNYDPNDYGWLEERAVITDGKKCFLYSLSDRYDPKAKFILIKTFVFDVDLSGFRHSETSKARALNSYYEEPVYNQKWQEAYQKGQHDGLFSDPFEMKIDVPEKYDKDPDLSIAYQSGFDAARQFGDGY